MINRRTFIMSLLGISIVPKSLPLNVREIYNQMQSPLDNVVPEWIYGIPYHQSNGPTGTWLGISRSDIAELRSDGDR